MESKIKLPVIIVGGTGYISEELLRILIFHKNVEVVQVISQSKAGFLVADVHSNLARFTSLKFDDRINPKYFKGKEGTANCKQVIHRLLILIGKYHLFLYWQGH